MGICTVLLSVCLLRCGKLDSLDNYKLDTEKCEKWELILDLQTNKGLTWDNIPPEISTIQVSYINDLSGQSCIV